MRRWVLLGLAAAGLLFVLAHWRETVPLLPISARPAVPTQMAAAAPRAEGAASEAAAPAAVDRADDGWVEVPLEVCGVGTVLGARRSGAPPLPGDMPVLPPHLGDYAVEAAREDLLKTLAAGPPRWQAAAQLMAGGEGRDALVRTALAGADPVVLQWALARCGDDAACLKLPLQRWLDVEPANAAPWLNLWYREPARRDEALAGLRRATFYRTGWGHLADAQVQAMPKHVLPYLQVPLAIEAIGIEAALPESSLWTLSRLCRPPLEAGSPHQADCEAWARLLVERGDTVLAQGLGVRLGERAGWPPERTRALKSELDRLYRSAATEVFDLANPFSCSATRRMAAWVREVAQRGEVEALRSSVAAASAAPPQTQKNPSLSGE